MTAKLDGKWHLAHCSFAQWL